MEMSTDPTDLDFEHAIVVEESVTGEAFRATCTCGWETTSRDELEANDAAGGHHAESIG